MKKSVSFVEMLIVAGIVGVLSLAIFSTYFSSNISWMTTSNSVLLDMKVQQALDILEKDLSQATRNFISFTPGGFDTITAIRTPVIVDKKVKLDPALRTVVWGADNIQNASYEYRVINGQLIRRFVNGANTTDKVLLNNIQRFKATRTGDVVIIDIMIREVIGRVNVPAQGRRSVRLRN